MLSSVYSQNLPKITTTGNSLATKTLLPSTKIRKGQGFGQSLAKKGQIFCKYLQKKIGLLTLPKRWNSPIDSKSLTNNSLYQINPLLSFWSPFRSWNIHKWYRHISAKNMAYLWILNIAKGQLISKRLLEKIAK